MRTWSQGFENTQPDPDSPYHIIPSILFPKPIILPKPVISKNVQPNPNPIPNPILPKPIFPIQPAITPTTPSTTKLVINVKHVENNNVTIEIDNYSDATNSIDPKHITVNTNNKITNHIDNKSEHDSDNDSVNECTSISDKRKRRKKKREERKKKKKERMNFCK
jgi:hypothetical protein